MGYSERDGLRNIALIEVKADGVTLIRDGASRQLSDQEWREWTALLTEQRVLELPPLIVPARETSNRDKIVEYEFLHLTRTRGRRVFMMRPGEQGASPYHILIERLRRLP